MAEVKTVELFGSMFTTHPITGYDGTEEPSPLKEAFDMLRKDYEDAGKEIIFMSTYYNSGYNSLTDEYEGEKEFGIEVEWKNK
jgi:hypothetical protein